MASSLLPVIESNACFELDNALKNLASNSMDYRFMYVVWDSYRNRGICAFFLGCDVSDLYVNLHKSACAYLHYLKNMAPEAEIYTSYSAPFFNAVACADWFAAEAIARASRHAHNPDEEYIDDFYYVYFLMKMFFLNGSPDELKILLGDFEKAAAEDTVSRYELCKSLLDRDQLVFDDAFEAIVEAYLATIDAKMEKGLISEEEWALSSPLFIEGLALLRLAEQRGLKTQTEYAAIPTMVRTDVLPDYQPSDWLTAAS